MTKTVTVASVDGGYITTDAAANFANQQAIVKFTLKDANGNDLKASSLTIAAASNRLLKGMLHNIPDIKHSGYNVLYEIRPFTDGSIYKMQDDNKSTKWCTSQSLDVMTMTFKPWYATFVTASPVQVDGYTLTTGDDTDYYSERNPKSWTLKGKLNLIDEWTTIATVTDDTWSDLTSYAGTMLKVLPPAYALGGKLTSLLV